MPYCFSCSLFPVPDGNIQQNHQHEDQSAEDERDMQRFLKAIVNAWLEIYCPAQPELARKVNSFMLQFYMFYFVKTYISLYCKLFFNQFQLFVVNVLVLPT